DLAARLTGGGKRREFRAIAAEAVPSPEKKEVVKANAAVVRLGRETKGRRGKGVTTVSDLPSMKLACWNSPPRSSSAAARAGRSETDGSRFRATNVTGWLRCWKAWATG